MLDLGTLPPEIISGRMYAGPGAESLAAAATSWQGLSAELASAAQSYGTVIASLGEQWTGPSAAAMSAAAEPFVAWLSTAAGQAKATAVQAGAAASAFETALAAVVPPPVIAANRSLRASLVASNVLGQNLAAIAAADAAYLQMWATDAAAMYSYAAASAAATRLSTPATPPQTTRDGGQASSAAAGAGANAAAGQTQAVIPQLLQALGAGGAPGVAGAGTAAGTAGTSSSLLTSLDSLYTTLFGLTGNVMKFDGIGNAAMSVPNFGMVEFKTFFKPLSLLPDIPKSALGAGLGTGGAGPLGAGLGLTGPASANAGGLIRAVTADVGTAPAVGALSVPQGWATTTPAIRLAATSLPASAAVAPLAGMTGMAENLINPATLGSLTGGALGSPGAKLINGAGIRGGVTARGKQAPVQLDQVIAQLQKQKDTVQHWQIDEAGLDDLLEELAKKPGFHAVHLKKGAGAESAAGTSKSG